MSIDVVVKKTIRINGREYGSLDEVPQETRAAVEKAMASASGVPLKGGASITVNGHTYSTVEELPAVLRMIVQAAVAQRAAPPATQSMRLEPVISPSVVAVLALLVVVFLLVRYGF